MGSLKGTYWNKKMKNDLDNAEWIHLLANKFPKTLETAIIYYN